MDISYDGKWGYAPLVVSLAGTREPLYIVNRSGNSPSHLSSAHWLDKALDLVSDTFKKVTVRGDTDFGLTGNFDKWDKRCTFVFGMDARQNLVKKANRIPELSWRQLSRKTYTPKTWERKRPENIKAYVVKERNFKQLQTECEHISEFDYKPGKCSKTYRMIILRKTINVLRSQTFLYDEPRYFFYITNDTKKTAEQLIEFYRKRADHENDIEQLKNGVRALKTPSDSLLSNWHIWLLPQWHGISRPGTGSCCRIGHWENKSHAWSLKGSFIH